MRTLHFNYPLHHGIVAGVGGLIDYYAESNQNSGQDIRASIPRVGQSISVTRACTIRSIRAYLTKVGTPPGVMTFNVYGTSGTVGTNAAPSGASLGASDSLSANTAISSSTTYGLVTFPFSTPISISGARTLALELTLPSVSSDATNYITWGLDSSAPSHGGNWFYYTASYNANATVDMIFYLSENSS